MSGEFAGAREVDHRAAIRSALEDDPQGDLRWWVAEAEALLDELVRYREPTPDALRELAGRMDDPNETPSVAVALPTSGPRGTPSHRRYTAGYLLRRIADALEQAEADG